MRPGRFLSIGIVLIWLGLIGLQLRASYVPAGSRTLVDLSGPIDGTAELTQRGVYYRGSRIGYIREKRLPVEGGFRSEQLAQLTLNVMGREQRMQMEGTADVDRSGELREFQFRLATPSRRSSFETTVTGRVEGDELVLSIDTGRSERSERRRLREPIVLPLNLYSSLATNGWTAGDTLRVRLFDPMTLSDGEAVIEVKDPEIVRWGGREEEAHRLQTTFAGLTTTAWVSEAGEVLQEETPLGWTLIKEAPGSSLGTRGADGSPDVLLSSSVPAIGFAGESKELKAATLRLVNFPDGFDALDGDRQSLDGDRVRIETETPPFVTKGALSRDELERALASDGFIQADDPDIVEHARSLTEGLSGIEKARALERWVYENVTKSPTLSIPSAREILANRVGDCNEHAVLYAALARASGVPTRIATGLAYTGGQFYYHAWPEVFVGRWLAVDPTFGQFPADPLHLRLLTGGLESQYEILNLLGRGAMIEVLETR